MAHLDNASTVKRKGRPSWTATMGKFKAELPFVLLMVKGSVAPIIGLSILQNQGVADYFGTVGFLIPIMTILTVPILPRARYIQNLLATCILVCFVAAVSLLAMWCSVKARINTDKASTEPHLPVDPKLPYLAPYNAASSINMAVWFFFALWINNTFRAYRPQYFLPSIVGSIYFNIVATYGTQFPSMHYAESLSSRLFKCFFVGFGISAAVNLLVIPFSCRTMFAMLAKEELLTFKNVFQAHTQFMLSLPKRDWYNVTNSGGLDERENNGFARNTPWPEAETLKTAIATVMELQVKIQAEMRYVKREAAWGKLGPNDISTACKLMKDILTAVIGMESITHVTDIIANRGGWGAVRLPSSDNPLTESELNALENEEKESWTWIFEKFQDPVSHLEQTVLEGLDHSLYTLEFAKKPVTPTKSDIEANTAGSSTETFNCADRLEHAIQRFMTERQGPLREWCTSKGMDDPFRGDTMKTTRYPLHERHKSQLHVILNMNFSLIMAAQATLDLVKFVDSKVEDGTMAKNRFIFPSLKQLGKWVIAAFRREDNELDYQMYSTRGGTVTVNLDDVVHAQKDPEHLPPANSWEKLTVYFRSIPEFFGSRESAFGCRVAVATFVLAIPCYFRDSQAFYIRERLIWASIMVAISMTQTAGSGIYGQFLRFSGTALAMVASFIAWYIVDKHPAGIIVFTGIFVFLYQYPMLKYPDFTVIPVIGAVTVILIVGYELQVEKIPVAVTLTSSQVLRPIYELAPIRLLTVLAGVGVAFLFTYFPSVVTTRTQLRKEIGSSLYLMGHYYSSSYKTGLLRLRGGEEDLRDKNSPAALLEKARTRMFAKEIVLLQGMRHQRRFTAWEPSFGGKFPQDTYDRIINHAKHIIHFTAIITFATETFQRDSKITKGEKTSESTWIKDFKQLISPTELANRTMNSLLFITATAISTGRPLPPYLKAPEPVQLEKLLGLIDSDILGSRHVCETGYAAFAVMQVATTMLTFEMEGLLEETRKLVGEISYGEEATVIQNL